MTSKSATIAHNQLAPSRRSTIVAWPLQPIADGVTVVSGPPGSGKTTLLRQWCRQRVAHRTPPVWLRASRWLTAEDILVSLDRSSSETPILLLDDADRLEPGVLDEVLLVLEGKDGWSLVAAARGPISADLDRLGWDRLTVLDHRKLRLSDDAVIEVISSHRPELGADELRTLADLVDGWAIGAQLAGRAMASATRLGEAVADFSGASQLVSDYLEAEVMSALGPRDQHFLVTCSVLPELTPESCTLLTGDRLSAERLARLGRLSAVIEGGPGNWRWRPMVRDFLCAKLGQRPSAEVAELHRRARGWSTARRSYDDAVSQGIASDDWNAVVAIILHSGPQISANGGSTKVLEWLGKLPAAVLEMEAGLSVVAALALWMSEGDDARPEIADWLAHARQVGSGRPPGRAPSVAATIAVLDAVSSPAGPTRRIDMARPLVDEFVQAPSWRALACWTLGTAAYLDDDAKTARLALSDYLTTITSIRPNHDQWLDPRLTAGAIGTLALIELDDGNVDRADILASTAGLQPAETTGPPTIGTLELARSRRALYSDADDALRSLNLLRSHPVLHEVRVLALLELARAYGERDMPSHHRECLAEADRLLREMASPGRLLARQRNIVDHRPEDAGYEAAGGSTLTEREIEVLRLLASNLSRRQIAEELFLAHNTVKTYVQRIYRKLGVSSRAAAVARGRERGWTP